MGIVEKLKKPIILKKTIQNDKEFLRPNTQVDKIEFVAPELIKQIREEERIAFAQSFQFQNLFIEDEPEGGFTKLVPIISGIISLVTLIIIIIK